MNKILGIATIFAIAACGGNSGNSGSGGDGGSGGDTSNGGKGGNSSGGNNSASGGNGNAAGSAGSASGGSGGKASTGGAGGTAGAGGMPGTGGVSGAGGMEPMPAAGCVKLKAKVFDFRTDHSDFQPVDPVSASAIVNFVQDTLGSDGNPQLIDGVASSFVKNAASFKQWYTPTEGVNKVVQVELESKKRSTLLNAFGSDLATGEWFPIDAQGWGNMDYVAPRVAASAEEAAGDVAHNQLFTSKIEARFYYQGGKSETIISESDDDSWVFINGKLAVDNGGLKGFSPASVKLDSVADKLGIKPGHNYPIVFFFAERLFGGASYRVSHNILFSHCTP